MSTECIVCARPMADQAYCCTACTASAALSLAEIAEVAPAARDVAHGLSRRSQGGASGKPGSRLPLDLGATSRLDAVQTTLTKWIDRIGPTRGITRPWFTNPDGDRIAIAANWLTDQLEWIRHQPDREPDDEGNTWCADQFLTDIDACARIVRGTARGPSEQKYLGPCGADRWCCDRGEHEGHLDGPCEGDVYGRAGATTGTCRTCGATVDQAERRAWLDQRVTEHLADTPLPARDIAFSLRLAVKTIRSWASTVVTETGYVQRVAKLKTYWRNGEHVVPWEEPAPGEDVKARGPRLHYVGDVQALAEQTADDRQRRAAARAAESEEAA